MMSSTRVSRFLSPRSGNPSIYETIREHEEAHTGADAAEDIEEGFDDRNLEEQFHDEDIEAALAEVTESQTTTESTAFLAQQQGRRAVDKDERPRPRWAQWRSRNTPRTKDEDDVPQSLLYEGGRDDSRSPDERRQRAPLREALPEPVPGPSSRTARIQWDTVQAQQQLHNDRDRHSQQAPPAPMTASGFYITTPEDKAMWRWVNVDNLDTFLNDVYDYYTGKGMWSITLSRLLSLAQSAFIVALGIFLTYSVDYAAIPTSKKLSDIVLPNSTSAMGFFPSLMLWLFTIWWFLRAARMVMELRKLRILHDFYLHLLKITDDDLQTVSWQEIVGRLMDLRDANPRTTSKVSKKTRKFVGDNSKDRMDAIDIANRIMRRENYMIALFNKDVFDMTLPIPFIGNRQFYSKNLEWNIQQIILGHFFNDKGQVYQYFLKPTDRQKLIKALQDRFLFYGCMNLIQAPFLISFNLIVYVLRYFKEFQRDPSQLGSRAYTPMAEWKFREFNELPHFFRRRADMSFPYATQYLLQFPRDKTVQISSFVAFVSGALLALLAMASLLDPSNFLNFELTSGRTVLFYLGVLTVVWTVCRGAVPEENEVYDPEFAIQQVINFTHYSPANWKGRLHSDEVRRQFSNLYQPRILIFAEELASFIFAPLVLWYSMPKCCDRIVDFFREFTVHVDGLGYVCWFAQFEFNTTGGPGNDEGLRQDYYASNDNKAYSSYYHFIHNYGTNQKKGLHGSVRAFYPPPMYPALTAEPMTTSTAQQRRSPSAPTSVPQSAHSMNRSQVEPTQSLLLDPHHQPPASVSRRLPKSKMTASQRQIPHERLKETDEDAQETSPLPHPMTSTTMLEADSDLGASWKTTRAATADDDDDTDEGTNGGGAGVLGLLYQFQKAQTEGPKGTGVGI